MITFQTSVVIFSDPMFCFFGNHGIHTVLIAQVSISSSISNQEHYVVCLFD